MIRFDQGFAGFGLTAVVKDPGAIDTVLDRGTVTDPTVGTTTGGGTSTGGGAVVTGGSGTATTGTVISPVRQDTLKRTPRLGTYWGRVGGGKLSGNGQDVYVSFETPHGFQTGDIISFPSGAPEPTVWSTPKEVVQIVSPTQLRFTEYRAPIGSLDDGPTGNAATNPPPEARVSLPVVLFAAPGEADYAAKKQAAVEAMWTLMAVGAPNAWALKNGTPRQKALAGRALSSAQVARVAELSAPAEDNAIATFSTPHGLRAGDVVGISGPKDADFGLGLRRVIEVSPTAIRYYDPGPPGANTTDPYVFTYLNHETAQQDAARDEQVAIAAWEARKERERIAAEEKAKAEALEHARAALQAKLDAEARAQAQAEADAAAKAKADADAYALAHPGFKLTKAHALLGGAAVLAYAFLRKKSA